MLTSAHSKTHIPFHCLPSDDSLIIRAAEEKNKGAKRGAGIFPVPLSPVHFLKKRLRSSRKLFCSGLTLSPLMSPNSRRSSF